MSQPGGALAGNAQAAAGPRRLLSGVVPPLVTPFDRHGEVDRSSLAALCDYLIAAGVHGLYPCGSFGECALLTTREREAVAKTTIQAAAGRVPVYVHVGAASTAETVALARHAAAAGADGVGAVTPYYYTYTDDDLRRHYLQLAEAVAPLPVYLYSLPSHAHHVISATLADDLSRRADNIVGIKDSGGSADSLRELRAIPNFSVISGIDGLALTGLRLGCDGMVAGNANAAPGVFVALWNAWYAGDVDAAQRAQERIEAVRVFLAAGPRFARFKEVLGQRGVLRTAVVRDPQPPLIGGEDLAGMVDSLSGRLIPAGT